MRSMVASVVTGDGWVATKLNDTRKTTVATILIVLKFYLRMTCRLE